MAAGGDTLVVRCGITVRSAVVSTERGREAGATVPVLVAKALYRVPEKATRAAMGGIRQVS